MIAHAALLGHFSLQFSVYFPQILQNEDPFLR